MTKKPRKSIVEEELKDTFEFFDKDQNGYLTENELRAVMKTIGEEFTDTEIVNMMHEVDSDKDGKINCQGTLFNQLSKFNLLFFFNFYL